MAAPRRASGGTEAGGGIRRITGSDAAIIPPISLSLHNTIVGTGNVHIAVIDTDERGPGVVFPFKAFPDISAEWRKLGRAAAPATVEMMIGTAGKRVDADKAATVTMLAAAFGWNHPDTGKRKKIHTALRKMMRKRRAARLVAVVLPGNLQIAWLVGDPTGRTGAELIQ